MTRFSDMAAIALNGFTGAMLAERQGSVNARAWAAGQSISVMMRRRVTG
jgi:hypothetical protein